MNVKISPPKDDNQKVSFKDLDPIIKGVIMPHKSKGPNEGMIHKVLFNYMTTKIDEYIAELFEHEEEEDSEDELFKKYGEN